MCESVEINAILISIELAPTCNNNSIKHFIRTKLEQQTRKG